jgi:hypothetical protein
VLLSVHAGPHRASLQISSSPQARPQTPQFFLSEKTFVHELPQGISPLEQDNSGDIVIRVVAVTPCVEVPQNVHRPFSQVCPDEQAFPQ